MEREARRCTTKWGVRFGANGRGEAEREPARARLERCGDATRSGRPKGKTDTARPGVAPLRPGNCRTAHRDQSVPFPQPRGVSSVPAPTSKMQPALSGEIGTGVNVLERETLVLGHERRRSDVVARYDIANFEGVLAIAGIR